MDAQKKSVNLLMPIQKSVNVLNAQTKISVNYSRQLYKMARSFQIQNAYD